MILRKNNSRIIKLQQGGAMPLATPITDKQLGAVPVDITTGIAMPATGASQRSSSASAIPKSLTKSTNKPTESKIKGLPSDVAFITNSIDNAKKELTSLSETQGNEESPKFRLIAEQLRRLIIQRGNTASLASDFNKAVPQSSISTGSLAIYNNTAVVRDLKTNEVDIVPIGNALSTDSSGRPNYTILNAGDAVQERKFNPKFSGFTREGQLLTGMLSHVEKKDVLDKKLTNAFKQSGFQAGIGTTLITPDNKAVDAYEVFKLALNQNTVAKETKSYKTNEQALNAMRRGLYSTLESDDDLKSALFARSIAVAKAQVPNFYKLSTDKKSSVINKIQNNLIDQSIASQLKSTYGDKFSVKAKSESTAKYTTYDKTLDSEASLQPFDVGEGAYKLSGTTVYLHTHKLPGGSRILSTGYDKTRGKRLDNLIYLPSISKNGLTSSLMTFDNVPVASIVGDLSQVIAAPSDIDILRDVPVRKDTNGDIIIDKEFLAAETKLRNEKKRLIKVAYNTLERKYPQEFVKIKEHTFANLPSTTQGEIVKQLENSDEAKSLDKMSKTGVFRTNLAKFNVYMNVENSNFAGLFSSGTPADIYKIDNNGIYKKVDDRFFDENAGKKDSTRLNTNVYETAVYVPLANDNVLSTIPYNKSITKTKEQVIREKKKDNAAQEHKVIHIESLIKSL